MNDKTLPDQDALQRLHRVLDSVMEDLPVLEIGADGKVLQATPAFAALAGSTPNRLAGRLATKLVQPSSGSLDEDGDVTVTVLGARGIDRKSVV